MHGRSTRCTPKATTSTSPTSPTSASTPAASCTRRLRDLPIEELEFENNSIGNLIARRSRLPELTDEECAELLDLIVELELADGPLGDGVDRPRPDADSA